MIVNSTAPQSGQYDAASYDLSHYPQSDAQKGAIRNGQPFACKTSLEPPPEKTLPCVNEVTFGRVHMTGNLCPISARRIPPAEFDGLPGNVQQMLLDQALNGPLDRRLAKFMPSTFGDTRIGGLPAVPTSVTLRRLRAGQRPLDARHGATPPDRGLLEGEARRRQELQSRPGPARHGPDLRRQGQARCSTASSSIRSARRRPMLVPSDAGAAIDGIKQMTVSSTNVATALGGIPIGDPGRLSTDLEDRVKQEARRRPSAGAPAEGRQPRRAQGLPEGQARPRPVQARGRREGQAQQRRHRDDRRLRGAAQAADQARAPSRSARGVQVNASRDGPAVAQGGPPERAVGLPRRRAHQGPGARLRRQRAVRARESCCSRRSTPASRSTGSGSTTAGRFQALDVDYLAGAGQGIPIGYGHLHDQDRRRVVAGPGRDPGAHGDQRRPVDGRRLPDGRAWTRSSPSTSRPTRSSWTRRATSGSSASRWPARTSTPTRRAWSTSAPASTSTSGRCTSARNFHGRLQLPRWQVDFRGEGGIRAPAGGGGQGADRQPRPGRLRAASRSSRRPRSPMRWRSPAAPACASGRHPAARLPRS